MIPTPWRHAALAFLVLAVCLPAAAHAQTAGGFSGFGGSDGGPIQIEARELEVRDKEGVAIFTGDVVVKQGETTLETAKLVVHYVGGGQGAGGGEGAKKEGGGKKKAAEAAAAAAAAGQPAATPTATPAAAGGAAPVAGSQEIDRLEASGKVLVTSKDQTASGDSATYDGKTEVLELRGDVVLTQGKNVVRGDRLVVEMQTGRARVLSTKSRVQMLLTPGSETKPAGN